MEKTAERCRHSEVEKTCARVPRDRAVSVYVRARDFARVCTRKNAASVCVCVYVRARKTWTSVKARWLMRFT